MLGEKLRYASVVSCKISALPLTSCLLSVLDTPSDAQELLLAELRRPRRKLEIKPGLANALPTVLLLQPLNSPFFLFSGFFLFWRGDALVVLGVYS